MFALIIGAGNSLSTQIAQVYRGLFQRVFLCDINKQQARKEAESVGIDSIDFSVNALEPMSVASALRFAQPHHVLNLVGGGQFRIASEITPDEFLTILRNNVVTAHVITTEYWKTLDAMGIRGSIVHVSSINSQSPVKGYCAYSTGKAALEAYVRSSALEYAPILRTFAVRVGPVEPVGDSLNALIKRQCTPFHLIEKRLTTGRDVGQVTAAMHTSLLWVTGETINVDGGLLLATEK